MEDIKNTLGIVQAVLRDAERRSVREEAVNLWLKMLKDAAYDISDMFDEFEDELSKITREDTTNSMLLSMHDLIHDLARSVLGDELLFVDGKKGYNSRSGNHRYALVVNGTSQIDFGNYVPTKLRSLHLFDSGEIHPSLYSVSLRVLDISKYSSGNFPASIGKLKQLKYLRARGMQHGSVPEDVTSLSKLIYLDISGSSKISTLPSSVKSLRSLMHLDLSGSCNLCSLPESFGELINLSHLNLAKCNGLRSLPKSFGRLCELQYLNLADCLRLDLWFDIETVCCLTKLQYLNLSRCPSLMHIPESVINLKNLHTLDLSRCHWIQRFPESLCGMPSLKFLLIHECTPWFQQRVRESQFKNDMLTLPKFIVQRTASGQSSNISRLQSVYPAELEIECLENVASIEEANAVNLADKPVLANLVLAWTPAVEHFVEDEALLRELQPPENLMFLRVQGYMATSFSGWVMGMESCLLHLICIEMVDLPRCEHLPPFGQLKNLQQLILKRMPILKKLGTEICGGSGAFKKLKEFTLENLDILEEWVTKVPANGEFMFPSLNKLEICQCPKLRLTPCLPRAFEWRIQASDEVIASQYDAGSSSSLTLSKLHVASCQLQHNQWALLGFFPALEVLEISNYQQGKLPDSISFLVSLRSLKLEVSTDDPEEQFNWLLFLSAISGDRGVVMFPLPQLTALENLEICYNNELQTWCKSHDRWTLQNAKNESATFFERHLVMIQQKEQERPLSRYILRVKQQAEALSAIGQTLRDNEVIRCILHWREGGITNFDDMLVLKRIFNVYYDYDYDYGVDWEVTRINGVTLNDLYVRVVMDEEGRQHSTDDETVSAPTTPRKKEKEWLAALGCSGPAARPTTAAIQRRHLSPSPGATRMTTISTARAVPARSEVCFDSLTDMGVEGLVHES